MEFKEALAYGKRFENYILDRVQVKYPCAFIVPGKFKPYDIWIPEINRAIEVKADLKSQETGNIVIEIEMFGRPSGLLTTKADDWVICTGDYFYWIEPQELIKQIMLWNKPYVKFVGNGDKASKKAYLVPVHLIKKWCSSWIKESINIE